MVSVSLAACIVIGIGFLTTLPQEHQTGGEISDAESARRQRHKTEMELKQMLLDYDRENIVDAVVFLSEKDSEIKYVNIMVEGRDEIINAEKQDEIRALVSEYLDLDAQNISLICEECADSAASST